MTDNARVGAGTPWQPIASAPAVGAFLVYLDGPIYDSRIHVLSRLRISNGVAEVMCGHFMGDYPEKPTHWMPLPAPPQPDRRDPKDGAGGFPLNYRGTQTI